MKKILTTLILVLVVIVVTGCFNKKTSTTNTTAGTTASTTATTGSTGTTATTQQEIPLTYPSGTYSYRFANSDVRNAFFAAAENYLLHNNYAGIPVFANAGFALYSQRVQLPVDTYVPVIGYGTGFGTMSSDDSTVLMDSGSLGSVGEYTFRDSLPQNPTTFNQWIYDDSTSADVMSLFLDSPYTYVFNTAKDGYSLVPSMAAAEPTPINPEVIGGVTVAKTWQISYRHDLKWTFHPSTDTSAFAAGYDVIDAHDFYDTYRLALTNKWFRAISGGGDFLATSQEIVGAQAYVDGLDGGTANWDNVGIKLIDDYTIQFEFVNDMSAWNVKYWNSDFTMGPINMDLYNAVGTAYGTTPETTAYSGIYTMEYYEPDRIIRFSKNDNFHDKDLYHYTGYSYSIIEDADMRFNEFIGGKLDIVALPTSKYQSFINYPGLKRIPGATTFRIMINGLGTAENQQAQFPESTFVPEPLLANSDFKTAMYFAIDRKTLAEDVLKTSQTQMYLFTDAYVVDASTGVPFRNTEIGQTVGSDLSPETNGFNADLAAAYWRSAIDALVADGTYAEGTADNPTIISIDLNIFSGSEAQQLFGDFIKQSFETTFVSDTHHIQVQVNVTPTQFPSIYYDYMMVGQFDISVGGISGSTLDAASFLDTYCSDNRGGFTLNWGIDTSVAEIEVDYINPETGLPVREMWSFDAITAALNGSVELVNGAEKPAETPAE